MGSGRRPVYLFALGCLALVGLGSASIQVQRAPAAQLDPTQQQQTVEAFIQQQFNQTAQARQAVAATQTAQAQFGAAQTGTAVFQATLQAAFELAVISTMEAQAAQTRTAEAAAVVVTQTQVIAATQTMNAIAAATSTAIYQFAVGFSGRNADWTPVIAAFDGVPMALVPAGCFVMGSDTGSPAVRPAHEVCFDDPFWIDVYEVSNGQFAAFGGTARRSAQWSGADRPRERVTWEEALAFCADRRGARLPTEAEWEYAARGPDGLTYPWGNEFDTLNAVYFGNSNRQTAPVGEGVRVGGASWVGAVDLTGNVWEWVSSLLRSYPYLADDGREAGASRDQRVLRGGSWNDSAGVVRAFDRLSGRATDSSNLWGFRCARDHEAVN